jgi:hypothetical protein
LKNVTRRMVARQRKPERYFVAQIGISLKLLFWLDCRMLDKEPLGRRDVRTLAAAEPKSHVDKIRRSR